MKFSLLRITETKANVLRKIYRTTKYTDKHIYRVSCLWGKFNSYLYYTWLFSIAEKPVLIKLIGFEAILEKPLSM